MPAKLSRLNVLASWYDMRTDKRFVELLMHVAPYVNLLIDSGAFGNYTQTRKIAKIGFAEPGVIISIQEYIRAAKGFHDHVWGYFVLDVIKDPVNSRRHLQMMLDAGLTPIPIKVHGENIDDFMRLVGGWATWCAISGVNYNPVATALELQTLHDQTKLNIHALGYSKWPNVAVLPIATCDASSWTMAGRYGEMVLFSQQRGLYGMKWRAMAKPHPDVAIIKAAMDACNYDAEILSHRKGTYSSLIPFTVNSYINFMQHLHKFCQRGYFLAVNNPQWFISMLEPVAAKQGEYFDIKAAQVWSAPLRAWYREGHTFKVGDAIITMLKEKTDCARPIAPLERFV